MELNESRKLIILKLISEFKKNDTYTMYKDDFDKIIDNNNEIKIITEILKYKLELILPSTKDTYRLTKAGILFSSFETLESEKTKTIINAFNNSTIGQFNQESFSSENLISIKTKAVLSNNPAKKSRLITILSNPWFIGISLTFLAAVFNAKRFMSFINNIFDNY